MRYPLYTYSQCHQPLHHRLTEQANPSTIAKPHKNDYPRQDPHEEKGSCNTKTIIKYFPKLSTGDPKKANRHKSTRNRNRITTDVDDPWT